MEFLSKLQSRLYGPFQRLPDFPWPTRDEGLYPLFQSWHAFDASSNEWTKFDPTSNAADQAGSNGQLQPQTPLLLVTWNVDSGAPQPEKRLTAIVAHIETTFPQVSIIFFQEVSRTAFSQLLETPWIRDNWYSSEATEPMWESRSFSSVMLLSKARFGPRGLSNKLIPFRVWRLKYLSRFGRDALCCDVQLPDAVSTAVGYNEFRLINVHLDSLRINPSLRPAQLSAVASLIHVMGQGLVAGDFNPVLPEDHALVRQNRLVDAWSMLQPDDPGYTWGLDGKQSYSPSRLDKVAMNGLSPKSIKVITPEEIDVDVMERCMVDGFPEEVWSTACVPWSDHCGLALSFDIQRPDVQSSPEKGSELPIIPKH